MLNESILLSLICLIFLGYSMLQKASEIDFPTLIDIWEKSVRATHDFLPEEEINNLNPLILNEYFPHVLLHKYVQNGKIVGFIGTRHCCTKI